MPSHAISVHTKEKKQVVDITDSVNDTLTTMSAKEGIATVFVTHTTAALTTADLDPGTDLDMLDAFDALIPKLKYRHPHDPSHVPDHILSTLIGASVSVPVRDGQLVLGSWQRVVLFEFNGPRDRQIIISLQT